MNPEVSLKKLSTYEVKAKAARFASKALRNEKINICVKFPSSRKKKYTPKASRGWVNEMYTILCLNNDLSVSSDRNIAGTIVPSAPRATKPIFPPPARARSELDKDKIKVALKFNKVTDKIPTKEIGNAY